MENRSRALGAWLPVVFLFFWSYVALSFANSQPFTPLVLKNNSFWNCSALGVQLQPLFVLKNTSLTLINVTFSDCSAGALVINCTNSASTYSVTLQDVRFINNTATKSVVSVPSVLNPTDTVTSGAALVVLGTVKARLVECTFTGNSAQYASAIFSNAGSVIDGYLTLDGCVFSGNQGHGVMLVSQGAIGGLSDSSFSGNRGGSAVYLYNLRKPATSSSSTLTMDNVTFRNNSADSSATVAESGTSCLGLSGAALCIEQSTVPIIIQGGLFDGNSAFNQGGAVAAIGGELLTSLVGCNLTNNAATLYGGAVFVSDGASLAANQSTFQANKAPQGGALAAVLTASVVVVECTFAKNEGRRFGGAISGSSAASLSVYNSTLTSNTAGYAGGIECWTCLQLYVQGSQFLQNTASGAAGALGLAAVTSAVTLKDNVFRGNAAPTNQSVKVQHCVRDSVGMGGAMCVSYQASVTLNNNTFENNVATTAGAAYVSRQCDVQVDSDTCLKSSFNVLADNKLVNNTAVGGAGGAVYALNVSTLSVQCVSSNGSIVQYQGSDITDWPYGANGCLSWLGNAATAGGYGSGLATALVGVRMYGNVTNMVVNYSSNDPLPVNLELYDALGTAMTKGSYEVDSTTVAIDLTLDTNLVDWVGGGYSNTSLQGLARFDSLKLRAPPGTYNLTFYGLPSGATTSSTENQTFTVEVRPCALGEIANSNVCEVCAGPVSFSFNALNSTCDTCDDNALCMHTSTAVYKSFVSANDTNSTSSNNSTYADSNASGRRLLSSNTTSNTTTANGGYLVPLDGYWHSSPLSTQIHECPVSDACTYAGRLARVGLFQEERLTLADTQIPPPNGSVLADPFEYWQIQCATGYIGPLCALCDSPAYGWRSNGNCYECPSLGLNTLYYCLSYLVTIVLIIVTINSTLTRSIGESRAAARAEREAGLLRNSCDGNSDGSEVEMYDSGGGGSGGGSRRRGSGTVGAAAADGSGGGDVDFSLQGIRGRSSSGLAGGGRGSSGSGALDEPAVGRSPRDSRNGSRSGSGFGRGLNQTARGKDSQASRQGGPGVLELAAAAVLAQLEAESSGGGSRRSSNSDSDEEGGDRTPPGDGVYGTYTSYGAGGIFSSGYAGGGYTIDPRQPSIAPLPKAALPGMRHGGRVPRSVRARESRLAQASGPTVSVDGGGGGGAAAVTETSDASDGNVSPVSRQRHRLSKMSRGAVEPDSAGAGGGVGGPVAEGKLGPEAARSSGDGDPVSGGSERVGGLWGQGMRRRKPGAEGAGMDVGGSGGGGWQRIQDSDAGTDGNAADGEESDGGGSRKRRGGGGRWLWSLVALRGRVKRVKGRLEEQQLERDEKPPHTVVLKILVNYIQVTSVVRDLSLDFPESLDKLMEIGSMATSAVTTFVSLDCSLPTNGLSLALQRTLIYVSVPWVILVLAAPVWLVLYVMHARQRRRTVPGTLREEENARAVAESEGGEGASLEPSPLRAANGNPAAALGTGDAVRADITQVVPYKNAAAKGLGTDVPGKTLTEDRGGAAAGGSLGMESASGKERRLMAEAERAKNASRHRRTGPVTFSSYMTTRMVVTIITVIFYFYPSVTDAILSILQCERVDELTGAYQGYLKAVGYFWELDYGLRCFRSQHLLLTVIVAAPGLALFCIGVPLSSALWLRHNAAKDRLNTLDFSERYGFLYEDYRRETFYWESMIMLRKLLVVGLLIITNSADDVTRVMAVMGVVLVAMAVQLYCRPFELDRFNGLETVSLGSTVVILYLCTFFLMGNLTEAGKQALSVLIMFIYLGVFAWFGYCLIREVWRYAVRVLDADGNGKVSGKEVRQWLKLRLGAPLAALVAWVGAPLHRARRRRRRRARKAAGAASSEDASAAAGRPPSAGDAAWSAPPRPPPPPPPAGSAPMGAEVAMGSKPQATATGIGVPVGESVVRLPGGGKPTGAAAAFGLPSDQRWTSSAAVDTTGVRRRHANFSPPPLRTSTAAAEAGPMALPGALPASPQGLFADQTRAGLAGLPGFDDGSSGPRTTAMLELVVHSPSGTTGGTVGGGRARWGL